VKILRLAIPLLLLIVFASACTSSTPTLEAEKPPLPTPDVPPITEIDAAIELWEKSNSTRYFMEVEERNQDEQWKIRLQVVDDRIRTAQRVELDSEGNWGEPFSISLDEAQAYTVDSILQRIREDVLGRGPALVNLLVTINQSLGYPIAVHAEALPSYNEEGNLDLNRQHSYDLTMRVQALMEDTYGVGQEMIYSLTRSGGLDAWCDNLRIFSDGYSVYADDCRNGFLRMVVPESRMAKLEELRSSFASTDDLRIENDQVQRLIILGTGEGTPDASTLKTAWEISDELHDILSKPIGLGLVLSYTQNGKLIGFDVFNKTWLPAQLPTDGDLRGALLTPDGALLAYSDNAGLSIRDIQSQQIELLLPSPESGHYLPRSWANSDLLLVSLIPESDSEPIQHGWISLEDKEWEELPSPDGISGYGCDTGASWSPDGDIVAITGLEYGTPCNTSPGLSVANISSGTAQLLVAPMVNTGENNGDTLIAGAYTPAWSPDGTWIAVGLDQDATDPLSFPTRLYRVHPDGSNLTPLTNNTQGNATHPIWAEDSTLFYGLTGAGADLDGLYQYLPTENTHTLLIPGSGILPLSISPDGEFLLYEQDRVFKIWQFRLQEIIAEISGEEDSHPTFVGWILINDEQ
jgi:hypothetical protein